MLHDRRLCALIPARGGSKGIPRKNLHRIGGLTLVEHAMRLARASSQVDVVYVSTDDPETYAIAAAGGCATPRPRPATLATDGARTVDVVANLVDEGVLQRSDCILLLQPTTPLRTLAHLQSLCALLESRWDDADAVVSVCKIDGPHPFKAQTIDSGFLRSLVAQDASVPRQSLPAAYLPNGAFYLAKTGVLLDEQTFMPARSLSFVMNAIESINLDGPLDLVLLEAVLEKKLATLE